MAHHDHLVWILYPEKRWVTASKLLDWYEDAVVNDRIAEEYLHAATLQQVIDGLSDAGIITNSDVNGDLSYIRLTQIRKGE